MSLTETNELIGPNKLDAFRLSDDLAVELFKVTRSLPADVRWLVSQVMRAASSVPANICEGYARGSRKQFLQFLIIARASLAEVEYWLHFMKRTELISGETHDRLGKTRHEAARRLFGLIRSISRSGGKAGDYASIEHNRFAQNLPAERAVTEVESG